MINNRKFKDIKTCFCFLDETGLIHHKKDKFFAIGIIKCNNPQKLYNRIRKIRDKYNYREELKWTRLDRKIRFDIAREFFNRYIPYPIRTKRFLIDQYPNGYFLI